MLKLENLELQNGVKINSTFLENNRYVIIGANGSGKSTLLKTIAGLILGKKGEIFYNDDLLKKLSPSFRSSIISYLPQSFTPSSYIKVIDFVLIGAIIPSRKIFLEYRKNSYDEALTLLKDLEILHLKEKDINELSGGELMLVSFARSIMQNSLFLLLDEVESGLDYKHLEIYRHYLKNNLANKAIIEVTHNLNYVLNLGSDTKVLAIINDEFFEYRVDEITSEILEKIYHVPIKIHGLEGLRFCI